jgi:hypothetical protein
LRAKNNTVLHAWAMEHNYFLNVHSMTLAGIATKKKLNKFYVSMALKLSGKYVPIK